MVVVAVAGGTGGVGRTIVETLLQSPTHRTIVLTRKIPDEPLFSATTIAVDYSDVDSVAKILADNEVDTVISALRVLDEPTSNSEVNLVRATVKAGTPRRFMASVWGIQYSPESTVGKARERTLIELRRTQLEWTRFNNGYFLDYYAPPSLKSHMLRVAFGIDIANKKAAIPGDGNALMTFTYTFDVARFVVASLDLPKWDELLYCYGEKLTWNEFLRQAGEVTGFKFQVAYDSPDKLQKGDVTELPTNEDPGPDFTKGQLKILLGIWGGFALEGMYDMPTEITLNKGFPDINVMKVKDVLEMWRAQ
ncbi:hypothetical protein MCOR02_009777 [Pyricularia oryzae]|uniref:NAD(P)-binding domain-containing protein n=2 Tax=Pyricularia TaxID=48558 RepID=A0ABQ8NZZ6_PYRGI|nr:hypothetical protein MCOR02_009777 [Pyricularia oryzae]KAI6304267.1 hypothetical protein MCOR33_000782 [Pyricularia grisea]KAI6285933.1 hypothetical protein MCOR26_001308 [Pyricularia oryzae]KAI6306468.1 hypothetical protein MCOR30_011760 [Pyricularia oryzae]KAI6312086.1 hypothetical protein MCOR34_005723 [Pyricularia oryzae]